MARDLPKGVYRAPRGRVYVQISIKGKNHNLGRFDTPEEAHEVWLRAARDYDAKYPRRGDLRGIRE
jgi:hypothetical protein